MSKIDDLPTFLTAREYADITRSNYNVTLRKIKEGRLPAIRRGKGWLIPTELVFDLSVKEEKDLCKMN